MRRFVIISVIFIACGEGEYIDAKSSKIVPDTTPTVDKAMPSISQDEALIKITNQFYADAKRFDVKTDRSLESVSLVDTLENQEDTVVGLCTIFSYDNGEVAEKTITILKSYWQEASPVCRASLVYHELGHCALNLEHTDEKAKAIMRPSVFCDTYAKKNWNKLVRELFYTS